MVKIVNDNLPLISVTLTEGDTFLTRYDGKGRPCQSYPVKIADVGMALRAGVSSGLLPPDVLFWQIVDNQCRMAIWIQPQIHGLTFNKGRRGQAMTVPMPGFVFVGHGTRYYLHAASTRPALGDRLFVAPLPNVFPGGLICAGNVDFPVCDPDTIASAAKIFFDSRFSNHLSERKIKAKVHETLEQKLRSLHGSQGAFPTKWLLSGPTTMKSILEGSDEYR